MKEAVKKVAEKIEIFADETNKLFQSGSAEPATINDLAELSKQTFYALTSIQKALEELAK